MNPAESPLLTDLYQLTMLQAYFARGMQETAVFELFSRKLPAGRNFLVAAGLEQALDFIEGLRFSEEELDWIAASDLFRGDFPGELAKLRFTGDVHAMPEGRVFFANEPILRVTAPLPERLLIVAPLLVPEMSKVPLAVTPLDAATLPLPLSASVPPLITVPPV